MVSHGFLIRGWHIDYIWLHLNFTYIYTYIYTFIYLYIYTYIYTTCLFMKSPCNIYIYSVYAVKWTSALVLGSAQVVVYQIDWQSTGQQHRGLTLSTTRLSGWTLPDHPHLIVDHEFIRICPTAKYADISYSLQCGSRTDSAHESETWTNRKNKKWTCMLFKNRIPLLFRGLFQEQMP